MTKKMYMKTLPTNVPLIKSFLNNFQNQVLLFTEFFLSFKANSKYRRQNFQNKKYKNVHDTLAKFKLNFKRIRLQF